MADTGASLLADSLKCQGVDYLFGVVGIPIVEVALAAQVSGVKYIGMRNEQAASYAASVIGYLTKRPGACLVVPGPGLIHALAGIVNAHVNCWPLVVIAGSFDQDQVGMGGFQELNQISSVESSCKYCARIETLESIPFHIEKAVRMSIYGRPGPTYIEIPGNLVNESPSAEINAQVPFNTCSMIPKCPDPPKCLADPLAIQQAIECLRGAKKPLVIIGKGAAYSGAETELRYLMVTSSLPFLPTPMGKGVIPDDHPLCVAAARSKALKEADVILLVGARLNWILHFGRPPRFNPHVKIIQIDISPEEMGNNVPAHVMLCGDVKAIIKQLNDALNEGTISGEKGKGGGERVRGLTVNTRGQWWTELKQKVQTNVELNKVQASDKTLPMNFYCAYKQITDYLSRSTIIVNEGANTMDIGRTVIKSYYPRHRLDAGTFGTMGVGCGFAIAAAIYQENTPVNSSARERRHPPVVCIQGDSAFGFSGMEVETACRYKLPIIFIIMNNSGIYRGIEREQWEELQQTSDDLCLSCPPTSLTHSAEYNKLGSCFGAPGFNVVSPEELQKVMKLVTSIEYAPSLPVLINVQISPASERRQQEFPWLTKSNL